MSGKIWTEQYFQFLLGSFVYTSWLDPIISCSENPPYSLWMHVEKLSKNAKYDVGIQIYIKVSKSLLIGEPIFLEYRLGHTSGLLLEKSLFKDDRESASKEVQSPEESRSLQPLASPWITDAGWLPEGDDLGEDQGMADNGDGEDEADDIDIGVWMLDA